MKYRTFSDVFELLGEFRKVVNKDSKSYSIVCMEICGDGSGHIEQDSKRLAGFRNAADAYRELEKLIATSTVTRVVLNAQYTAEVTEDGITVGCQEIPFEAVDKLAEAVKEIRSRGRIGKS